MFLALAIIFGLVYGIAHAMCSDIRRNTVQMQQELAVLLAQQEQESA